MSTAQRKDSRHLFNSFYTCKLKLPEDQRQQEKSVIAQPIFVFAKREQTFKRPAEDTLYEAAEHESNGFLRKRVRSSSFTLHTTHLQSQGASALSQNRMRSSSFTDLPTFPPSGPVKKNNVFMTSTHVQRNVDMNSAEQGPVKHSEHVLRPAILQPPQAQRCEKARKTFGHDTLESCKIKDKTKNKISEGSSCLLGEKLPSTRISVLLTTKQNCLGATSVGCQPNEQKYSFKSCRSDFVFGENMVERVLDIQHLTQSQPENDSYTKEQPFKSVLEFPVNSLNSNSIKNISLIESAAAFSSKPSPKCLLQKIDVVTGEEAEHNVLKINCKLFIFNKTTQSWTERGRGALRLNDTASSDCGTFQSRLIMRNQGSLRLILNSKLWAQMEIQRANHKNLRITATDLEDYNIKVFLIQASAKDTGYLYAAIHHRLVALRSFGKQEDVNQAESQSDAILQQLNCESCDEDEDDFIKATKNRSDPSRWTHRQSVACS
ncbi:ran-binding protein 3-like isoform X1 [Panthera pardus]|uniref:Ran-binding protein 3-like n=2 Tax=Panthera pardus TaxID=9691 RepID=A0A9V1F1R0_PANPR|nr:ran-binding protein 3-like isoform X1 [Panthera pardus]XP_049504117.1 ran-binding protein 3-like isoform X1 [Panthera uncia]